MDYVCNSLKQIWKKEKLVQKGYENEDFFTIIYPKISINVVKTMSPWESPQQLPSAKMNFEDWVNLFHSELEVFWFKPH